jgi:hypothetical protein
MEGQSTIDNPNEQAPFGHKTKNEDKEHWPIGKTF